MPAPIIMMSKHVECMLNKPEFIARHMATYNELIESIRLSEVKSGAHLKPIDHVLSLRVGIKARLLAKKKWVNGQLVWVLLELLPNHKYDKARYLKPGMLGRFFDENNDRILALALSNNRTEVLSIDDNSEEKLAGAGVGLDESIDPVEEVVIYKRQLVHLTDTQDECLENILNGLNRERFVGLVAGAPGSGKTLLAKEIIDSMLDAQDDTTRIFYIAESRLLREEMEKQCGVLAAGKVECSGYLQMLHHAGVELDGMDAVDDADLVQFFSGIKETASTLSSIKTGEEKSIEEQLASISFEQFRQECMVMSGIKNTDEAGCVEYCSLGGSHSLFHENPALQQRLWEIFQQYMQGLQAKNKYHPQLTRFDVDAIEGNVVLIVDEALDLTRVQLQTLFKMGVKVVCLGDHHQNLKLTSHSMEYLNGLIAKLASSAPSEVHTYVAKLEQSYRCSEKIAGILSQLLKMKRNVTVHGSDLVDTHVISALKDNGRLAVSDCKPKQIEHVKQLCKSAATAVICPDISKQSVSKQLDTELVFTIDEIKGMGYHRIVCWDVISRETAKRLINLLEGPKKKRDEMSVEDKLLITDLNRIFTAVSRAEMELVFMISDTHPSITNCIHGLIKEVGFSSLETLGSEADMSTEDQWRAEALRQFEVGNIERASNIAERFGFSLPPTIDLPPAEKTLQGGEALQGSGESKAPDDVGPADRDEATRTVLAAQVLKANVQKIATKKNRQSKKKKKKKKNPRTVDAVLPPRKKEWLGEEKAPDTDAPSAIPDADFAITFKFKRKAKHNKAVVKRTIDFSSALSVEDIEFLLKKSVKGYEKLKARHIEALFMAKFMSVDADVKIYILYKLLILHITFYYRPPILELFDEWMSGKRDLSSQSKYADHDELKDRVIYKLICHPESSQVMLIATAPIVMQLARINTTIASKLREGLPKIIPGTERSVVRFYAIEAPVNYAGILELCHPEYYICDSEDVEKKQADLMRKVVAGTLMDVDMLEGGRGACRNFNGDENKVNATVLACLILNPECAPELFSLAKRSPEIRAVLVAELSQIKHLYYFTDEPGSLLHQLLVINPECFLMVVEMAFTHTEFRELLVDTLQKKILGDVRHACLLSVVDASADVYTKLCELAKLYEDVAELFVQVIFYSAPNIKQICFSEKEFQSGVLSPLLDACKASPLLYERISKDFFRVMTPPGLLVGDRRSMRLLDYVARYDDNGVYYNFIMDLASAVPQVAKAYIEAIKLNDRPRRQTHLHILAIHNPVLCARVINWAKRRGGAFNEIISLMQASEEGEASPLDFFSRKIPSRMMVEVSALIEASDQEEVEKQIQILEAAITLAKRFKGVCDDSSSAADTVGLFRRTASVEADGVEESAAQASMAARLSPH
ncbi:MAG: AAA family ATPase [Coxiellaceae bacterium]|nr:AAA family ATPase [Coxiellaceae bacterium]